MINSKCFEYSRRHNRLTAQWGDVVPGDSPFIPVSIQVRHSTETYEFVQNEIIRINGELVRVEYFNQQLGWTLWLLPEQGFKVYQPEQFDLFHDGAHTRYTAEASDLGLRPGDWPAEMWVETSPSSFTRFAMTGAVAQKGEVQFVMYHSPRKDVVKILND